MITCASSISIGSLLAAPCPTKRTHTNTFSPLSGLERLDPQVGVGLHPARGLPAHSLNSAVDVGVRVATGGVVLAVLVPELELRHAPPFIEGGVAGEHGLEVLARHPAAGLPLP